MPTPDFTALVKDALEHLYDPVYLREHPLSTLLLPRRRLAGVGIAQALRQRLLDAVDRLKPGPAVPAGARERHCFQILQLRYVEGLPFRDVMTQLGVSQTQYHREQRYALEALADVLREDVESEGPDAGTPAARSSYAEVEAVTQNSESLTDLNDALQGVVEMLRPVALSRAVALREQLLAWPTMVHGNRTAIRQLVISLLGYALGGASGGELVLSCSENQGTVVLNVTYSGSAAKAPLETAEASERLAVVRQLLATLGGALQTECSASGLALAVTLPVQRHRLLVIDDNPDAIQFVRRLVADRNYAVVGAGSVSEGLALARTSRPDAILLDIMIPERDGWDALQALKHDPATESIPVLVSTILGESQLALALGAAEFIRKPPTRSGLLAALAHCTAPSPPPEAGGRESSGRG